MSSENGLITLDHVYVALAPVEQVKALLSQETDPRRVSHFAKRVEAAKRLDSQNSERRDYWGELALFSGRRLGELIRRGQDEGVLATRECNPGNSSVSHDAIPLTLADLGISKDESSRAQKL